MSAIISDLDGTAFFWGTNQFVPGAYETLKDSYDRGDQLIFMTQRNRAWETAQPVEKYLKSLFPDCVVIFNISSPRILLNDQGATAINHPRNIGWTYDFLELISI